jgi:hypothetical protein
MNDLLNKLPIIKRETWGQNFAPLWPASPQWPPVYHTPMFLVIHHTVTSAHWQPVQAVQALWRYHAQTQGWGDIRYHYLIGSDGSIFEGRWAGAKPANIYVEGGQSTRSSTHKVGIALLGQFEPGVAHPPAVEPSPAALEALVRLSSAICALLGLDPLSEAHHPLENKNYPIISGHREHSRTRCPGENLYKLIPDLRQQVNTWLHEYEVNAVALSDPDAIILTPTAEQVAWGKSVWPNLLWGDDDLYAGVWDDTVYYSLVEFTLPETVREQEITGVELILTGQSDNHLLEVGGTFRAVLLAAPLRGDSTVTIPFNVLRHAPALTKFLPPLTATDLAPRAENRLTIDPVDLGDVNLAAASGYLAIRLEGPKNGRQLFSWDSGYGEGGLLVKPSLILHTT